MKKLPNASVSRSGATSKYLTHTSSKVSLGAKAEKLRIEFDINSKGGGVTELYIDIGSEDFVMLVESMIAADRHNTMTAMTKFLALEVGRQPDVDDATRKEAFSAMVDEARKRYEAGGESVDLDYIVYQKIKRIFGDLAG